MPCNAYGKQATVRGIVNSNEPEGFAVSFDEPVRGLICKDGLVPEIVY